MKKMFLLNLFVLSMGLSIYCEKNEIKVGQDANFVGVDSVEQGASIETISGLYKQISLWPENTKINVNGKMRLFRRVRDPLKWKIGEIEVRADIDTGPLESETDENMFDAHFDFNNSFTRYAASNNPIISYDKLKQLINYCVKTFKDKRVPSSLYIQKKVLNSEVEQQNEIAFIGDIHGSVHSLLKNLSDLRDKRYLDDNFKIIKSNFYMIFTGDYVDRGFYGAEVWYTLMKLKLANWSNVFLLRGNHEDKAQNNSLATHGFFIRELPCKYRIPTELATLKSNFSELYECLPMALYLGIHGAENAELNWIQCCHGGTGENLGKFDLVNCLRTFLEKSPEEAFEVISSDEAKECFLWGDFFNFGGGTIICMDRNAAGTYSDDIVKFLKGCNVKAVFRGHQHFGSGLKMFASYDMVDDDGAAYDKPVSWEYVVQKNEMTDGQFFIHKYIPVFTFTTATDYGLATEVFYGILKTTPNFNEWTLKPVVVECLVRTFKPLPVISK